MCGIAGIVGRFEQQELEVMTDALRHRGPDGRGTKTFAGALPAGLGHRRLAILDPTPAGAQPMGFHDRWWITYNGEIYNFPRLKAELEQRGERFATSCDTEVLLRLFALEGPGMVARLNGIFAFAIWDDVEKRLFAARDRLGVKPLYYTQARPGTVAFGSELRCLLPLLDRVGLDPSAVADYLTFLWVPDPRTAFAGVHKLPPGHQLWADADGVRVEQYWDLAMAPEGGGEDVWVERVREGVTGAVRRQMLSDVPVGSFLSGGIDSSAIVAAMAGDGRPQRTFTVGVTAEDLRHEIVPDDLTHARRVSARFRTRHHEIMLQPDILDLLPKAIWHLEEPVADPAAISTYLICREAGRTIPVMLSGIGGDEVFAGYPRHLAYAISRGLDGIPPGVRRGLERLVEPLARPGAAGRLRGPRRNLWKYMRAAGMTPAERYISFLTYYPDAELRALLSPDLRATLGAHDPRARHREHLERARTYSELNRLLYLDAKTFLPNLNLTYTDKMSMAASVEVRVPLLDDEIVALTSRIPPELKLKGRRRKYVFKRSQQGTLPESVIWRPKAGFGAPLRAWMGGDLKPMIDDLLSEANVRERGLVDPAEVARLRRENDSGAADYSLQIYALLCLELWCRQWLEQPWTFDRLARESAQVQLVRPAAT